MFQNIIYFIMCNNHGMTSSRTKQQNIYLKVTPPINVPRNKAVLTTFAAGSVAKFGKSWMYVARHVNTAARPTKLKNKTIYLLTS